jgi:hypothetical protein
VAHPVPVLVPSGVHRHLYPGQLSGSPIFEELILMRNLRDQRVNRGRF